MLQLNHSKPTNQFVVIAETTAPQVIVEFTQDYNENKTYATASLVDGGKYLICNITGSQIPTSSGLYSVNFYKGITTSSIMEVSRAYVSGSDKTNITFYTGSNDIAYLYTYDGK